MVHKYRTRFVVLASLWGGLATFHSRTVPSVLPVARVVPPGLNATEVTGPVCPVRGGPAGWWVVRSHSCAVPSLLPVARVVPCGLNATEVTLPVKGLIRGVPIGWW